MNRRSVLTAAVLSVGAVAVGRPALATGSAKVGPASTGLASTRPVSTGLALPEDLAQLPAPRATLMASPGLDLPGVPEWKGRPLGVPARYGSAFFTATDNRGTFYGMLPRPIDQSSSVLTMRGGRVTEALVKGFTRSMPRAANSRGDVVLTATAIDTEAEIDSFVLRGGRLTAIPRADGVYFVSAHGITEAGVISGRYDEQFATWQAANPRRPSLRSVPIPDGEPRECFIDDDGALVGNVLQVVDGAFVSGVYRMQGSASRRLDVLNAIDVRCVGVAGGHAICRVIEAQSERAIVWERSGRQYRLDGIRTPVRINRSGLVAGYPGADQSGALLWRDGNLVGKVTATEGTVVVILGLTDRGELYGRREHADGRIEHLIWAPWH